MSRIVRCRWKKNEFPYQWHGLRDTGRFQSLSDNIHQDLIGMGGFFAAFQQQSISWCNSQRCHLRSKMKASKYSWAHLWHLTTWHSVRNIIKLTCGRTSGRDSKMTSKTPMGTVTWVNSSPVDRRVRRITRPTILELLSAICFSPSLKLFNFDGVRVRRPRKGPTPPCFVVLVSFKIFKSSALAFKIWGWRCSSNSAKFWMMSERWLPVRFCSWRPPSRAVC